MSYELKITEARFSDVLRSGVLFEICEGEKTVSRGRIKTNGRMIYDGAFPTKEVAHAMKAISQAYAEGKTPVSGPLGAPKPKLAMKAKPPTKRKPRKTMKVSEEE